MTKPQQWLKALKIATLTKDAQALRVHVQDMPSFEGESVMIIEETMHYLQKAKAFLKQENAKLSANMQHNRTKKKLNSALGLMQNGYKDVYI